MPCQNSSFKRTKYTCFYTYVALASVFALPPLLFVTFRRMYEISYTLLGTLVLINFCTQLIIDLLFTFFPQRFNIKKSVTVMPLLTSTGLMIYALVPTFFPSYAYWGLVLGTVVFSVAAGLCEVLLSPIVAAIPSDNPQRDMSLLHSLYAVGVVTVTLISSLFLWVFGSENWMYLTLFWAALPLVSFVLFATSPIPPIETSSHKGSASSKGRIAALAMFTLCIFLGGAGENAMTNWISTFLESALGISKSVCDIVGLALFASLLGLGRVLYAKFGKNISKILLWGMAGAFGCYIIAGISPNAILSLIACIFTGFCTSMLWPGTLIYMEERVPSPGVTAYALMAAGGDLGSSVAPQLLGVVVDGVSQSGLGLTLAKTLDITAEQVGMKAGMLLSSLFPLMGIILVLFMKKHFSKNKEEI